MARRLLKSQRDLFDFTAATRQSERANHKHAFDYAAFVGAEPPTGDDE